MVSGDNDSAGARLPTLLHEVGLVEAWRGQGGEL
jgi:hypothetical protein